MTTPQAGMPRGSTSGGLADRTYGGVNRRGLEARDLSGRLKPSAKRER
jgi:hypothetical protein